jgi:hypothetical protein
MSMSVIGQPIMWTVRCTRVRQPWRRARPQTEHIAVLTPPTIKGRRSQVLGKRGEEPMSSCTCKYQVRQGEDRFLTAAAATYLGPATERVGLALTADLHYPSSLLMHVRPFRLLKGSASQEG